ncbi:hypothetical protein [Ensifer sp. LC54]|uniref:hypothetical protein n=1 Tax=Ensifer sp. LC54 TaxID=1873715 RepID=UPI000813917C|nr:hypothetical protein [Ensifer sp. LC54]OCP21956.1 hypothetical protein BC361_25645 [Ensifer sp. LC54]
MGALGRLTRKVKKIERQAQFDAKFPTISRRSEARPLIGFLDGLTPEQRTRALAVGDDVVVFPMEMTVREVEERCTIGEIQPSHPMRYESHGQEFKGRVFNGECNRAACNSRGAIYYNRGTFSQPRHAQAALHRCRCQPDARAHG